METLEIGTIKHSPPTASAVSGKKGGRPKPTSPKKERTIMLTDDEYGKVKALAAVGKSSISDVVRRSISGQQARSAPNVQNAVAWGDLSRVVANLNQIAFRVNFLSKGGDDRVTDVEVVKTLAHVNKQIAALRKEILEM